jgi:predicted nuclease with TOPRIM domain
VAFLLAFENDRLIRENDTLKQMVKDAEGGGEKYKELLAKYEALVQENNRLKSDNDQKDARIKQLEAELADLRSKYNSVD